MLRDHRRQPLVQALDKDREQELSSREIRNATKSLLKLDKDKNGSLTEEELKPKPPKGERRRRNDDESERPPKSSLISALDADQSGDLFEAEILIAAEALIALDRDEDGELSSDAPPFSPMNFAQPGFPRPFRQKQISSSMTDGTILWDTHLTGLGYGHGLIATNSQSTVSILAQQESDQATAASGGAGGAG